jgi:CubicO group peptidase (beta-lactamase class C family)
MPARTPTSANRPNEFWIKNGAAFIQLNFQVWRALYSCREDPAPLEYELRRSEAGQWQVRRAGSAAEWQPWGKVFRVWAARERQIEQAYAQWVRSTQPPAPAIEPTPAQRALIERYLLPQPLHLQVALALVQGEKVVYLGAERTAEGIRYADNRRTVFEIGSISKVFTATLLAQAVTTGALSLETPVQELLPFKLKLPGRDGVAITLKHLASHTSGLRQHQPPGINLYALLHGHPRQPFKDYGPARFERFWTRQMVLTHTPGTHYSYSNLGMSLVGYILARQAQTSFEALLQARLFQPLGMASSSTEVAAVQAQVVRGLEKAGRWAPNWDMYALAPAGGIKTCTEDFARFAQAQFAAGPANALAQAPVFEISKHYWVGLGWHILERPDGARWLNHGGGMLGYAANINLDVARQRAAIVLSNLGATPWQSQTFELSAALLEQCAAD